jgi:hypothetical protein
MRHLALLVLFVGVLVAGCDPVAPPSSTGKPDLIYVSSAQEFIDALGPMRTLVLRGDVMYRLNLLPRDVSDYYRWEEAIPGQAGLVVSNCDDLTIKALPGQGAAHIATIHPYANVLSFENCKRLRLENLKIGHDPNPGYCTGGVLGLENCQDVWIAWTILYGCGTEGLTLTSVDDMTFVDSVIEQCTYGLLTAYDCDGLTFRQSIFRDTEEFHGFALTDTINVVLEDCRIENNTIPGDSAALFTTNLTVPRGQVRMTGGALVGNTVPALVRPEGMLVLDGVDVRENSHQAPENFPSAE